MLCFLTNITTFRNESSDDALMVFISYSFERAIGILKEYLPRIFEPYYTTRPAGHGLGLASYFSIIKRQEGCIDVESELGNGSPSVLGRYDLSSFTSLMNSSTGAKAAKSYVPSLRLYQFSNPYSLAIL